MAWVIVQLFVSIHCMLSWLKIDKWMFLCHQHPTHVKLFWVQILRKRRWRFLALNMWLTVVLWSVEFMIQRPVWTHWKWRKLVKIKPVNVVEGLVVSLKDFAIERIQSMNLVKWKSLLHQKFWGVTLLQRYTALRIRSNKPIFIDIHLFNQTYRYFNWWRLALIAKNLILLIVRILNLFNQPSTN